MYSMKLISCIQYAFKEMNKDNNNQLVIFVIFGA